MSVRETERGGLLLVDKPEGISSHDAVVRARRALGRQRIGHTGTLDPFATGLVLLCVGAVTRLAELFHLLEKRYDATLRLGIETDTHDLTGAVTDRSEGCDTLSLERFAAALRSQVGPRLQRPPAFSAKKIGGQRAHRRARAGEALELQPVSIEVHSAEVVSFEPPHATLRLRVSTGTYVRAIARDLGRDLGCGAHLAALRRTGIGPFGVDDAIGVGELEDAEARWRAWRSPAEAVAWLPARELEAAEVARVRTGGRVPRGRLRQNPAWASPVADRESAPVALLHQGHLVGVAERHDGELQPRKVLPQ